MAGQTARPTAPPCCPQHIHLPTREVETARQMQTDTDNRDSNEDRMKKKRTMEKKEQRKVGIEMWREGG